MPTSAKTPGTETSTDWGSSTPAWTTGGIASSDDVYTTVTLGSLQLSDWLVLTNLNFAGDVGASDTVDGLTFKLEWKADGAGVVVPPLSDPVLPAGEGGIALVIGGTIQPTQGPTTYPADPTTTEGVVTIGGSAETWGGFTTAQARASNFGIAIRLQNTLTKTRTVSLDTGTGYLEYTAVQGQNHLLTLGCS